jgi:hypothetical protein
VEHESRAQLVLKAFGMVRQGHQPAITAATEPLTYGNLCRHLQSRLSVRLVARTLTLDKSRVGASPVVSRCPTSSDNACQSLPPFCARPRLKGGVVWLDPLEVPRATLELG